MTVKAKHTKGPWEAFGSCVANPRNTNGGFRVCDLAGPDQAANGRLIAAAPDLLAALKEAKAWIRGPGTPDERGAKCNTLTEAENIISAALAKAEGATP